MRMPKIYVDGDACPVKAETVRVAGRHGWAVVIVCNGGIRPFAETFVEVAVVPDTPDAADDWIAARIGPGDLCITADIPLAARAVAAGAVALRPDGTALDAQSVGAALATRNLMADLRAANPLASGGGGGKAFGKAERSRYLQELDRMLARGRRA